MASQGPLDTGVGIDEGADWVTPSNIQTQDSVNATSILTEVPSSILNGSNFGFTIPAGTIDGIIVSIRRQAVSGDVFDSAIQIRVNGVDSSNKAGASAWSSIYASPSYGSSSDLWGLTPTVAQINATTFSVLISVVGGELGGVAGVDSVRVTVHYTPSGGTESLVVQTTITLNNSIALKVKRAVKPQQITTLNNSIGLPTKKGCSPKEITTFNDSIALSVKRGLNPQTLLTLNDSIALSIKKGLSPQSLITLNNSISLSVKKGLSPNTIILFNDAIGLAKLAGLDVDAPIGINASLGISKLSGLSPQTIITLYGGISLARIKSLGLSTSLSFNSSILVHNQSGLNPANTIVLSDSIGLSVKKGLKPETLVIFGASVGLAGINELHLWDKSINFILIDEGSIFKTQDNGVVYNYKEHELSI